MSRDFCAKFKIIGRLGKYWRQESKNNDGPAKLCFSSAVAGLCVCVSHACVSESVASDLCLYKGVVVARVEPSESAATRSEHSTPDQKSPRSSPSPQGTLRGTPPSPFPGASGELADALTLGTPSKRRRRSKVRTTRRLTAARDATSVRSLRVVLSGAGGAPQARSSRSRARIVGGEASTARTFSRSMGSTSALALAAGISCSASRCLLSRCAGRFECGRWQKSQARPLLQRPEET